MKRWNGGCDFTPSSSIQSGVGELRDLLTLSVKKHQHERNRNSYSWSRSTDNFSRDPSKSIALPSGFFKPRRHFCSRDFELQVMHAHHLQPSLQALNRSFLTRDLTPHSHCWVYFQVLCAQSLSRSHCYENCRCLTVLGRVARTEAKCKDSVAGTGPHWNTVQGRRGHSKSCLILFVVESSFAINLSYDVEAHRRRGSLESFVL